jgi:phage protein D
VMVAEITSLEATFSSDASPMLLVRGHDHRHRLARGRKTRTFYKMKDSAIFTQIANGAGLRARATDTKQTLEYVVQSNQTDLEFLQQRARLNGYEIAIKDKVLSFGPPQISGAAAATLALADDVVEFSPRLSTLAQVGQVHVRGWDVSKKQVFVGTAGVGQESSRMRGRASGPALADRAFGTSRVADVRLPVHTRAEAEQAAIGRFNELALSYIEGDVVCLGQPRLRPATVVDITGAGETFSGSYYIASVSHSLARDRGYQTTLVVRRNAA